jgi:hypothetical protein
MSIPQQFHQSWSEIDPSGAHGGLPGELEEFVGPALGDNPRTKNQDVKTVFNAVQASAASISRHPESNIEGPPRRGIVEETLRSMNWILERVLDRTHTLATNMFAWTHATPPYEPFTLIPIRYPLRQSFADQTIHYMLGTLVECAELNANGQHSGLDPNSAQRLMAPMFHLKGLIVKDYFDKEVAGEISLDELRTMMGSVKRVGPVIVPSGETQPPPSTGDVQEALSGIQLLQWYPQAEDWAVFADKQANLYHSERIWQPEGATGTTEDVAPHDPIPATGGFPTDSIG